LCVTERRCECWSRSRCTQTFPDGNDAQEEASRGERVMIYPCLFPTFHDMALLIDALSINMRDAGLIFEQSKTNQ